MEKSQALPVQTDTHCTKFSSAERWLVTVCCFLLFASPQAYSQDPGTEAYAEAALLPEAVTDVDVTVVASEDYYDPLEALNRKTFALNDGLYRYLLIPLSRGYIAVLPASVRQGVAGVFGNLREPLNLINHGLQGEFSHAGTNLLRFLTNSTLGILGIFDPAAVWFKLPDTDTSFNETLMQYHVGQGPYLVLPILGPSDFRNTTSTVAQSLAHPLRMLTDQPETSYFMVSDNFQAFTFSADSYLELRAESEDPYLYFRNQYLQAMDRDEQNLNGEAGE